MVCFPLLLPIKLSFLIFIASFLDCTLYSYYSFSPLKTIAISIPFQYSLEEPEREISILEEQQLNWEQSQKEAMIQCCKKIQKNKQLD